MVANKGKRYTIAEKIEYVQHAKARGFSVVAKEIGVSRQLVHHWCKLIKEGSLVVHPTEINRCNRNGQGRKTSITPEVENTLLTTFTELRDAKLRVTTKLLASKVIHTFPSFHTVALRNVRRRITSFLKEKRIANRRVTHQAQRGDNDPVIMNAWREEVNGQMALYNIPRENVVNADETNVPFVPLSNTTLNVRGYKTISVRKPDCSQRATLMIGVSASGEKLPPFIIFTGKISAASRVDKFFTKKNEERVDALAAGTLHANSAIGGFPLNCVYGVQAKAWMDQRTMLIWVSQVWKPWADSKNGTTMLLLDSFSVHMVRDVVSAIEACDTVVLFIPGGFTSGLQTMDVGLNKPFKVAMMDVYDDWYIRTQYNDLGQLVVSYPKPSRELVAQWVWKSWVESIRLDTILKTWRKVGVAVTPPDGAVEAHAVGNLDEHVDERLNHAEELYDDVM
jgi:transposase-like protein